MFEPGTALFLGLAHRLLVLGHIEFLLVLHLIPHVASPMFGRVQVVSGYLLLNLMLLYLLLLV